MTMRSVCCFVWQSEADDDLANEARQQERLRRLGWLAVK
ncbi:hypothetical protein BpOF4_10740 [Alkalihalophilus pseudofirmus OF4]|uniref:Uncharacterized protein n=1 Tax=Alkalihalophilus pseudofirmus (strain ATCC BAA-2126 / JCM 17055 / OF4) TaxID=398511 RepID=D3FUN1_ALKPO|nr:hypothetical protein BpOF4_10740 [Alkalihalophilus pseudofirmus OF4]